MGQITRDQLRTIAQRKMVDLNANDVDAAILQIAGTARSMGIEMIETEADRTFVPEDEDAETEEGEE